MVSISSPPIINGGPLLSTPYSAFSNRNSATVFKWGFRRDRDAKVVTHRTKGKEFRVLANPNASPVSPGNLKKVVIMVDPLEAKRLAAKQMEEFKAKEKFKRKRRIEAINGAWAMIGLTAGLVVEGQTGNSIVSQLAGYLAVITSFLLRFGY